LIYALKKIFSECKHQKLIDIILTLKYLKSSQEIAGFFCISEPQYLVELIKIYI